jgi:hypothetical protein
MIMTAAVHAAFFLVLAAAADPAVPAAGAVRARVHAVYVSAGPAGPAPADAPGRAAFERAVASAGAGPVEVVEIAGAPPPRAPAELADAQRKLSDLRFDDARAALDAAVAEATLTGGAGLGAAELDDLFLLRGVAALHQGDAGRARAWEDFVRAALLAPERVLDAGRFAPAVQERWRRAAAEAQRRPRGVLVVRAPAGARVAVDGRPPIAAPAVVPGLIHGEHLVRVEEPGRLPWATSAVLTAPALEIDVPARAVLTLDDRAAAERARRAPADAALVAAPLEGAGAAADDPLLELRLVRASDGSRLGEAIIRVDGARLAERSPSREGPGTLPGFPDDRSPRIADVEPAVHRLLATLAPPASLVAAPAATEQPAPSSASGPRRWWPWLAVGAALAAGAAIAAALSASGGGGDRNGFPVTADPRGLGK